LDRFPERAINLHLGLSPYYRGTATNFYPLLNEEPQYVGATIHLLDAGIDSGPILKHARPTITTADRPHTIGCKAILAGIEAMFAVLHDLERGKLAPVPQWEVPNARVYLRKDYHPRQVVELYRKLDAGLIPQYVERASEVAGRVRLVE
jgi:methionyl-tRNA formyltransferase